MSSKPLVSIIALNYNNSRYVISALESMAHQTYDNIELIIVDDCSTDNSLNLIKNWLPQCPLPVKLIEHKKNLGVCSTCNSGLKNASGEYISLIATDDILFSNKIDVQIQLLQNTDEYVCAVYSDMLLINEENLIIKDSYFYLIGVDDSIIKNIFDMSIPEQISFLINRNIFPAPSMLYKTHILNKLGGWDENLYFEDWDMNLRLIYAGYRFLWLSNKLVKYRFTQDSLTRKPNPRYWESYLTTISKYSGLSPGIDKIIKNKIKDCSPLIYQLNGKKSFYWLIKGFPFNGDIKPILYTFFSLVGIKYYHLKQVKELFNGIK